MQSERFDHVSQSLTHRLSRRWLLRGATGASGAWALRSRSNSAAQFDDPNACRFMLEALTSSGPLAGTSYAGDLKLTISDSGSIDNGSYTDATGTVSAVVGQAVGHWISMLITLADGSSLSLRGVGDSPVDTCQAPLLGYFSGPNLADTGSWIALPDGSSNSEAPAQPTRASGSVQPAPPVATAAPAQCAPADCGLAFVQDPVSCECVCAPDTTPCAGNCCPAGSSCVNGACGCPDGTEQCGITCVPSCTQGFLDLDSCTCMEESA